MSVIRFGPFSVRWGSARRAFKGPRHPGDTKAGRILISVGQSGAVRIDADHITGVIGRN